ncbi:MAG: hypothetical protein ACXWJH_04285 [Hyphomicrobium sp.]
MTPTLPANARVRTFFAVALQIARTFPALVDLAKAVHAGDRLGLRRAARAIAQAILDGARDRGTGPFLRSAIDQQRRTDPLTRLRPSRPGRTPQAVAARARRGDKVTA